MIEAVVLSIFKDVIKLGNDSVKVKPGHQATYPWVCSELFDLLLQYPGGLAAPVILTSLAAKHPNANHHARAAPTLKLSHILKGKSHPNGVASVTVASVQCICPPGPYQAPGCHRGGAWVLSLEDGSTSEPLLLYAHSCLTPLLAKQLDGQPSPMLGCRLRLAGQQRQPHRAPRPKLKAADTGGQQQQQHRHQSDAPGCFLPCRAWAVELDAADSAWVAENLSSHPLLGGAQFGVLYPLSSSHQVVSVISTPQEACIDGWIPVAVEAVDTHEASGSHNLRNSSVQIRGRWPGQTSGNERLDTVEASAALILQGEAAALAHALKPGDDLLLYSPLIRRGPHGSVHLELGPDTIIVVKAPPINAPLHQQGPAATSMDVDCAPDQSHWDKGSASVNTAHGATVPCAMGALKLNVLRQGMTGVALWATIHRIVRCQRQASAKSWLLHVVLKDGSGPNVQALMELSNGSRLVQQAREGHTVLVLGAQVSDPSLGSTWPTAMMRVAAGWVGQTSGRVLLWSEADPGSSLYNLSCMPGILSSPLLREERSVRELQGAAPLKEQAAVRVCRVEVVDAQVETQRVHRFCGRPVTACCLDMMLDDDEEDEEALALPEPGGDAAAPGPAATSAEADGWQQQQQQQPAVQPPVSPSKDMSLDGLWSCSFCGMEVSTSEVAWGLQGTVSIRQHQQTTSECPAPTDSSYEASALWEVEADEAALRSLIGTSAEAWRGMGSYARSRSKIEMLASSSQMIHGPSSDVADELKATPWPGRRFLASLYLTAAEDCAANGWTSRVALLQPV